VSDVFYGLIDAVKGYWSQKLGDSIPVNLAFTDERYSKEPTVPDPKQIFPEALISIIGIAPDDNRRHSVPEGIVEIDKTASVAKYKAVPVPINLEFQLDINCRKRIDLWPYNQIAIFEIEKKKKDPIIVNGREVFIESLPDNLFGDWNDEHKYWRSAWRFRVSTWIESTEVREVKLILQTIITMNDKVFEIPEA
jgi:hypothetical protein